MGKKCLSVSNALDGLTSSKRWLGADIYIAPPDDGNCSDEDSADADNPQLHNLSRKQLMANCGLQVTCSNNGNVKIIQRNPLIFHSNPGTQWICAVAIIQDVLGGSTRCTTSTA